MASHRQRLIAILVAWVVVMIGIVVLGALELTESPAFTILSTAEGFLTLALIDAAAVERRRRDPSKPAIVDDVRSDRPSA